MGLQKQRILYGDEYLTHYFLCRYIPKAAGSDRLSQSLVSFKKGYAPHAKAWIDCAVSEMRTISEVRESLVIRALGHDEQVVVENTGRSLDQLGVKIAHALNGSYQPECIQKSRVTQKLTSLTKAEREEALKNTYRFNMPDRTPKKILILDDILTSGATVRSIMQAILKVFSSASITIFTLATTDYNVLSNKDVKLKSSPYEWETNTGWLRVSEGQEYYAEALAKLKDHILRDSFQ